MNKKLDALAVATGWHAGRDISARTLKKRFFWSRKLNYELSERFVGIGIKIDLDQYETPEEAGKILAELRKKLSLMIQRPGLPVTSRKQPRQPEGW